MRSTKGPNIVFMKREDYSFKVNDQTITIHVKELTGAEILKKAGLTPPEDYELLLELDKDEFEPIQLTEKVDFSVRGVEVFRAREKNTVVIKVDNQDLKVQHVSTPNQILQRAGKNTDRFYLIEKRGEIEISFLNDAEVQLNLTPGQNFITKKKSGGHHNEKKLKLNFVVNGEEYIDDFNVNKPLKGAVEKALDKTGNGDEPLSRWVVKFQDQTLNLDLKIKDYDFPECALIMVSLKSAKGGI